MKRVVFLVLAVLLSGAWPASAQSAVPYAPADPIKRGMTAKDFPRVTKLAENVYAIQILPGQGVTTNSMAVITPDGVLVADGQGSIPAATLVMDEIKKLTPQPVKYFVVCSEHTDHTNGLSGFPSTATFISSPFTQKTFQTQADAPNRQPNAPPVIVPSVTVDDKKVIMLGGTEIQILKLGRSHTGGDIVVYLPKEKVLWMSETFNSNRFPTLRTGYPSEWVQAIDKAQHMDVAYYAGAHGIIDDAKSMKANLAEYRKALETLIAEAKRLHQAGGDPAVAFKQANFGPYAMWTDFDAQAPVAFKRAWDEIDGKLP
jgi:glyoxylase-like metal-dependent hydrolase (beta-lactamase superfamily II)